MAKCSHPINDASSVIRRTFGGLPMVDAKADFTLMIRTSNVKSAAGHEKDASNCILAKACQQQIGASIVAFFRQVAYLELPDSRGNSRVVRYMLDADTSAIVAAFDRGKAVKGEVTVTLRAPKRSQRLDVVLSQSRKNKARKREALLKGIILEGPKFGPTRNRARVMDMDVRNGTGLVQSIKKTIGKTRP